MDASAPAIGIHQLQRIDEWWERRQQIWRRYNIAFAGLPVQLPADPEPATRHAYHLYTLFIDADRAGIDRDGFLQAMTRQNIGAGVHYLSIPENPIYRKLYGWRLEDYPNARRIPCRPSAFPFRLYYRTMMSPTLSRQ